MSSDDLKDALSELLNSPEVQQSIKALEEAAPNLRAELPTILAEIWNEKVTPSIFWRASFMVGSRALESDSFIHQIFDAFGVEDTLVEEAELQELTQKLSAPNAIEFSPEQIPVIESSMEKTFKPELFARYKEGTLTISELLTEQPELLTK